MIAESATRVPSQTDQRVNEAIRRRTEKSIAYYGTVGCGEIDQRLKELDQEWDVERALEIGASCLSLTGLTLGLTRSRAWFLLPPVVMGFLLQHALQGWCPPLPVLRRLGFRTRREIDEERFALKTLRGDFQNTGSAQQGGQNVQQVLQAVQR